MRRSERMGAGVFEAASSPVRMQMLRLLSTRGALSYTEIMFALRFDPVHDAGKFVYHLKSLVRGGLIALDKKTRKYEITQLGEMVVSFTRDIEEYVNMKRGKMYVRTSRFSIEEFHRSKITKSLIVEAGMPSELADEIASEAEDRLSRLRTSYLTAPLIREFVNSILVEKRLEEYRHKLTRLGMPVYDVTHLMRMMGEKERVAESVKLAAGSSVMAEYALLESIPREVADAHLAGELHICNLDDWVLKPNEVQHDLRYFLKLGVAGEGPPSSLQEALMVTYQIFRLSSREVSGEQTADLFNVILAPFAEGIPENELRRLFATFFALFREDSISSEASAGFSLGLEFTVPTFIRNIEVIGPSGVVKGVYGDYEDEALRVLEAVIATADEVSCNRLLLNPRLIVKARPDAFDLGKLKSSIQKAHSLAATYGLPYFACLKIDEPTFYSASGLRLSSDGWETDCLRTGSLDTILLNLPRIAYRTSGNEEKFVEALLELADLAVTAFDVKRKMIEERMRQGLLPLLSARASRVPYFYLKNATCEVSFVGLNEAVVSCTGKPISSENISFAQAILKELSSHLNSISEERGVRLRVSQRPSNGASSRLAALDVEEYGQATVSAQGSKGFLFYTDMPAIPLFEEVGLEERLEAEAKLQSFTPGGHFTNICMSDSVAKSEKLLEITRKAFDLGVSFFAYSRNHSICQNCGNTSIGCMTRCSKCGSEDITILARLSSTYLPLFDWPEERRRFLDRRMRYDFS